MAGAALMLDTGAAHAGRELVGEFTASGFLFKDQIDVTAVEDPEIAGVVLYFSDFKRNIVDKLSRDFFSEPSQASLTCVVTGPVAIRDERRISSFEGEEVFSEQKGLNLFKNKTLRVRRLYDAERRTVVYVAYSTRLSTASDEGGVSTGRYRCGLALRGLGLGTRAARDQRRC
ncbi:Protein CreA [Tetrabaena socialis]|uniref:Protein CreA n=1 Tax=Tetrabaena socialis TaxID=47790 RepID=A0A2J7ZQ28_9CHLO|nr:Protein CreA [Tetrabaena socialis]|eukprot:PNH02371.1 Protein CreA [Tetrabaena socialis]